MYSHKYRYYLLRSDAMYSRNVTSGVATDACEQAGLCATTEPLSFVGPPSLPWCAFSAVHADASGNYHTDPTATEVNAAAFVGLRDEPAHVYEALLRQIAATLGWQLVIEEEDDGNEDVVLFDPQR